MPLACPLCQTELKLHLLQPQLSIISCPSESCIYPFNLSVEELHSKNLLIPITNQEIMTKMKQKFAETNVYENISEFITSRDDDIPPINLHIMSILYRICILEMKLLFHEEKN
ncbi:hypothetical protein JTP64_004767 [Candida tropicalis]|nr:hypothetical protein JTP64_004767 [Candida tropicalis]